MMLVRRLRQLSGVWRPAVLLMGDVAIAIGTFELAWHIRTLSSFGIFEAPLPKNVLTTIPHNYGMVVLSQVFLLWIVGLYKVNRNASGKMFLLVPPILFVQMMFLSFFYLLTFGRGGSPLSIFPVFWILNSIFTSLWRILTCYPGPLSTFFGKTGGREEIIFPAQEVTGNSRNKYNPRVSEIDRLKETVQVLWNQVNKLEQRVSPKRIDKEREKMLKFKPFYKVMNFFRKDLARVFILGFMILLISCAFLLIFKAEKTAEEVANVAYFLLVIGVGMKFVSMVRHKDHEKPD